MNCLQVINNGRVFERNRVTELLKDPQTMRQKESKVNNTIVHSITTKGTKRSITNDCGAWVVVGNRTFFRVVHTALYYM